MANFSDFPLHAAILQALSNEGYTKPTPIQAQALPLALAGRDLLGIAQTGTGKTAAFALPILNRLAQSGKPRLPRSCRALILSPTRELASQIAESFRTYGKGLKLITDVVFGGVPIGRQQRSLATGIDILVATPGRLLDLINQRALTLRDVEVLVLDEADQMLDLGFIHALKRILPMLPKERQSLFFSATMPKTIAGLASQFLSNPAQVTVAPVATTAERVTQGVMFIQNNQKQALLHAVLRDPAIERTLVFTRTKHGADKVVKQLVANGIEASAIHGNKSQVQRERALAAFRAGNCRVLVATDIAARGIDVDGVTHVINFELPNVPESYVHRIGRTARAGAAGIAIAFCCDEERPYLRDIERLTRLPIPQIALPEGIMALVASIAANTPKTPPRAPNAPGNPGQKRNNGPHQGRPNGNGAGRPDQRQDQASRGNANNRPQQRPGQRPAQPNAGRPAAQAGRKA